MLGYVNIGNGDDLFKDDEARRVTQRKNNAYHNLALAVGEYRTEYDNALLSDDDIIADVRMILNLED